jgi:hypothetical protein
MIVGTMVEGAAAVVQRREQNPIFFLIFSDRC